VNAYLNTGKLVKPLHTIVRVCMATS